MMRDATLSDDGLYRYVLHRWWSGGPVLTFIMLNPSTADAEVDDPTIRRCIGFSRDLGYDGIRVVNLYSLRATNPAELWKAADPTGGEVNDIYLIEQLRVASHQPVIAAWGANARPDRVDWLKSLPGAEHLQCLGVTKAGAPRHPLYLPASTRPTPWPPPEAAAAEFNAKHPVGTRVRYWPGAREGEGIVSTTRTTAWVVGGQPVVSVLGYAGGIALTHIQPITEATDGR
ncbi:DUF1643 domain-containing protein [Nocardioides sp. R-C-SC26]|uniref:DUF1643 domain-containing protein n=1 Tax=Nocardioides sp. R-C-SC26 TaxID=2870414 RepID=UPI001E5448FA|nr:DUF1643 domain-containing protein [Nocardioides sp. R-C-SC26]